MAKKIIYLPLDERPCNYKFPSEIFLNTDIDIITPPLDIMGKNRIAADFAQMKSFLFTEARDAYGVILSLDLFLYGGIVPSRIHSLSKEEVVERMHLLTELKQENPEILIYGFQLIMRTPQGNHGAEEPSYYEEYGAKIYLTGHYQNKQELGILTAQEAQHFASLDIPKEYMDDYLARRKQNAYFNIQTLDLVETGVIDFLIIPQDDASEYGYAAMDQHKVRNSIKEKRLQRKVLMYPGADEVGCTLAARFLNHVKGITPRVYVKYPSFSAKTVIPCLEDRYLDTTIQYQILAAGGVSVPSLADADMVLAALIGAEKMYPNPNQIFRRDIDVLSNLNETFHFLRYANEIGYAVGVADLIFLNGGSLEVLDLIKQYGLLERLGCYAGWNTSSNTLGTAIAQLMTFFYYDEREEHFLHLLKRYVEDIGYCGVVREQVTNALPTGLNYFAVKEPRGLAANMVGAGLEKFLQENLCEFMDSYTILDVNMPWSRMFEVDFDIQHKKK